jgi:hypothetical protein
MQELCDVPHASMEPDGELTGAEVWIPPHGRSRYQRLIFHILVSNILLSLFVPIVISPM